jgi:hypothetical protein
VFSARGVFFRQYWIEEENVLITGGGIDMRDKLR